MALPRVLVVTPDTFNQFSGGGVTLTNLFRGWPIDRLANLYEDRLEPDRSVCAHFYRLTDRELRRLMPLPRGSAVRRNGSASTDAAPQRIDAKESRPAYARIRSWAGPLARVLTGDAPPRLFVMTPEVERWVADFGPELIYTFAGTITQMQVVRSLAQRLDVPVALHMMDDWPTVIHGSGLIGTFLRRIALHQLAWLMQRASAHLGIGEQMCEEYAQRFGRPFEAFHNVLDLPHWVPESRQEWSAATPFRLLYAGSVVQRAQQEALQDICEATGRLAAAGHRVAMHVHAPQGQAQRLRLSPVARAVTCFGPPPDSSAVAADLAAADLLVLPYNFDAASERYVRLSFPTKLPAYMVSATPMLVYGPATVAAVRYAAAGGWAQVVSHPGVQGLQAAIQSLILDQDRRRALGTAARDAAITEHDAARVRPKFQQRLARAAERPRRAAAPRPGERGEQAG